MELTAVFAQEERIPLGGTAGRVTVCTGGARRGVLKFSISVADVHSYWYSFMTAPGERIPWNMEADFAGQRGMPFITFFNMAGTNKFAAGFCGCDCDNRFSGKMNQETGKYDISWEISSPDPIPDFIFWFDRVATPWQEAIARWRAHLPDLVCTFSAYSWYPVFCTWYAVHGAVTQSWCAKTAAKAAELGFGTFILDDGWCYPDMKRVCPKNISSWYEKIGDWKFDPVKFPDFGSHVKEVRKLGMKYLVWVAPYLIGLKSAMHRKLEKIPGAIIPGALEGYEKLDPGNAKAAKPILDLMEDLMTRWDLDGLKVDFLDQIHPDVDSPHAEACCRFTEELSRRIRKHNPDAMIEFRQSYAVPRMLRCGTQFRAGDAPFDFLLNLRRIAHIRLALGDHIPVHADPAYWPADELPVNISRHFIAMMAGVPMLSVELADLSPEAEAICRFWISFYRKNLIWFQKSGHWEFDYSGGQLGCVTAKTVRSELAIVVDPCRVPKITKPGYLLNLSYAPLTVPGAAVFDWCGKKIAGDTIPEGCGARVKP